MGMGGLMAEILEVDRNGPILVKLSGIDKCHSMHNYSVVCMSTANKNIPLVGRNTGPSFKVKELL